MMRIINIPHFPVLFPSTSHLVGLMVGSYFGFCMFEKAFVLSVGFLFFFTFYLKIITDSQEVTEIYTWRFHLTFTFPQKQKMDMGTINRHYSGFTSFTCTCVCAHVCVVLFSFLMCRCSLPPPESRQMLHQATLDTPHPSTPTRGRHSHNSVIL